MNRRAIPQLRKRRHCLVFFPLYLVRTVCRQPTQTELEETGIRACGPFGADIRRENLRFMQQDEDWIPLCKPRAPGA